MENYDFNELKKIHNKRLELHADYLREKHFTLGFLESHFALIEAEENLIQSEHCLLKKHTDFGHKFQMEVMT